MNAPRFAVIVLVMLLSAAAPAVAADGLPPFGKDTVLVWEARNQEFIDKLVVRIAEFLPDRFIEWEDATTQGTVFMESRDLVGAKGLVGTNLFKSGMDTRSKNTTILWLSRRIYQELKEKKKAKCDLDGVPGQLVNEGEGRLAVEVNGSALELPVIRVTDGRGGERWFLDDPENPLMVKHMVRTYTQVLTSITTNRQNTLRWIKGKKLEKRPW